ncbi:HAD family hydrolase [Candidatus Woesearchaeota archaeon]|nr:HAD family hydrolase [Candidatus Woesearchaeota archaeon]
MRVSFDLDGTLYNSFSMLSALDSEILKKHGYRPVTEDYYRRHFQSRDFGQFYREIGVADEDIESIRKMFNEEYLIAEQPHPIPAAYSVLREAEEAVGPENVSIVTNTRRILVRQRFERDGLMRYFSRAYSPKQSKAHTLCRLALREPDSMFVYVGDMLSDAEDCRDAKAMGAYNLFFCAVLHDYALNYPDRVVPIVEEHKSFMTSISGLDDISKIWDGYTRQ